MAIQKYEIYKFKDFVIPFQGNHWMDFLTQNPKAISFLIRYPEEIRCESCLCCNPESLPLLEKDPSLIDWVFLASNPNAVFLLEKNMEEIDWKSITKDKSYINKLRTHLRYHSYPGRQYCSWDSYLQPFKELTTADLQTIFWTLLSSNPAAIPLLEKYPSQIRWMALSRNPKGIPLLEKNTERIHWPSLRKNQASMPIYLKFPDKLSLSDSSTFSDEDLIRFAEKYPEKADWMRLSASPLAMSLLQKNVGKILYGSFSKNPKAIPILEKNNGLIHWAGLSQNPEGIHLLEKYPERIHWFHLSENPGAISALRENPDKIHWMKLMGNPNAYLLEDLLEQNIDKIDWHLVLYNKGLVSFVKNHPEKVDWTRIVYFDKKDPFWIVETYAEFIDLQQLPPTSCLTPYSKRYISQKDVWTNPRIFEVDKFILRKRMDLMRDELMALNFVPERISKWKENGYDLMNCI